LHYTILPENVFNVTVALLSPPCDQGGAGLDSVSFDCIASGRQDFSVA
jgi:hypothetical protein